EQPMALPYSTGIVITQHAAIMGALPFARPGTESGGALDGELPELGVLQFQEHHCSHFRKGARGKALHQPIGNAQIEAIIPWVAPSSPARALRLARGRAKADSARSPAPARGGPCSGPGCAALLPAVGSAGPGPARTGTCLECRCAARCNRMAGRAGALPPAAE